LKNPIFPEKSKLDIAISPITVEKKDKWIGIAPFAQYESKVYPLDLMEQVIAGLSSNQNYKIFLFGGGNKEIEILDQLAKDKEKVISIAGSIKFQQELELISNLDLMLSMDSGNAHIAAMLGVKVITLWGATHPFAGFAPFNQPVSNALVSDREQFPMLPTSVYGNKMVAEYSAVMRTILPETIINEIKKELQ
jgi:ADP-heptose:LPS heptosyltransferase